MTSDQDADVYAHLDELTVIKNDFVAGIRRQPGPGYGGAERRQQLGRDHDAVMDARQDEVLRLWKQDGVELDEISRHLDQTDPVRREEMGLDVKADPEAGQ